MTATITLAAILLFINRHSKVEFDELQLTSEFLQFKRKFNKQYNSLSEHSFRLSVFKRNIQLIKEHNSRNDTSYTLGINEFADLTFSEFSAYYLMKPVAQNVVSQSDSSDQSFGPDFEIDWRKKNVLPSVKNQGALHTSSVVTADIVSAIFSIVRKESPVDLSYQEISDCVSQEGENILYNTMKYALNKGIHKFETYPFSGNRSQCLKDLVGKGEYRIQGFGLTGPGPFNAIRQLEQQPISTGMSATEQFQFYKSGIFRPKSCPLDINHIVSIVGSHVDTRRNDNNHFIGRNTWGQSWGEDGYFRIGMSPDVGLCGFTSSGWMWHPELTN